MTETTETALPFIIVSGPTASGKSRLALELAQALSHEIVNIDSVQIYKGLDIGSAKASTQERENVRHHLLDMVEPCQQSTVSDYLAWVVALLPELESRHTRPIFVGGSSLYITCLLQGLAALPKGDKTLRAQLEQLDGAALMQRLEECDPKSAQKLHVNDRMRIIRALESATLHQQAASKTLADHGFAQPQHQALIIVPIWERAKLYARINLRSQAMLKLGLVEEARAIASKYGKEAPALKSLGYAQACAFLSGELSEEALLSELSQRTRNFAKRQMTFWRNEPHKRGWTVQPITENIVQENKAPKKFEVLELGFSELINKVRQFTAQRQSFTEVWYIDAERVLGELEQNS